MVLGCHSPTQAPSTDLHSRTRSRASSTHRPGSSTPAYLLSARSIQTSGTMSSGKVLSVRRPRRAQCPLLLNGSRSGRRNPRWHRIPAPRQPCDAGSGRVAFEGSAAERQSLGRRASRLSDRLSSAIRAALCRWRNFRATRPHVRRESARVRTRRAEEPSGLYVASPAKRI